MSDPLGSAVVFQFFVISVCRRPPQIGMYDFRMAVRECSLVAMDFGASIAPVHRKAYSIFMPNDFALLAKFFVLFPLGYLISGT